MKKKPRKEKIFLIKKGRLESKKKAKISSPSLFEFV